MDRYLFTIDTNDGDITIFDEFLFFYDDNIAIAEIGLHAVSLDTKGKELAMFDKAGIDIDVLFNVFNGFNWNAGRDGPKKRNPVDHRI